MEVKIKPGVRKNLARPSELPVETKYNFMKHIR